MRDATSEKRLMKQRKITCCNSKPKLLQQQKQIAMRDATSEKKTNAIKKNYLLQQQTKATATIETNRNARCNIRKKD